MLRKVFFTLLIPCVACSEGSPTSVPGLASGDEVPKTTALNGQESTEDATIALPGDRLTYVVHSGVNKVEDATSPFGFWTSEIEKPVFSHAEPGGELAAKKLNAYLNQAFTKIECDTAGDHGFHAEIDSASESKIFITLDLMWMCRAMPSPEMAEVSATFDARTGELLDENWEALEY